MSAYNRSTFSKALDQLFDAIFKPFKPKRQPTTKVRRLWTITDHRTGKTRTVWYWKCLTPECRHDALCNTWADAYRRADHHARTQH